MSSVLARPGAPTIRLLPPTNSVISTCEMTSSCPTMIFFSSVTMALRPAFMRSASAMSSGDARSTCGVTSVAIRFITPSFRPGGSTDPPLLSFRGPNFSRLQRNCRDQLLEFRRVFRRVHALFEQPQRLDTPLEIAPLHMQRAQLRIRRQAVVAGDAERQDRRDLAVLVFGIGAGVRRIGAAFLVAIVIEQRVLGGEQALALVGARHFRLR